MGNYRDHVQRVHMGRIAYVEATGESEIKMSFSAP
jgi:hypothetical protein